MPIYEYFCQACDRDFEEIKAYKDRDRVTCPDCDGKVDIKISTFDWKWFNKFTKDGEGYSSVTYHPDEYKERVRANAGKYD